FEDTILEMLHAEAQSRDTDLFDDTKFVVSEGSGFALESDLLGLVPGEKFLHGIGEIGQLLGGEIRGCATAKVDEFWFPLADEGLCRVEGQFSDGGIQIALDLCGVLVCVNAEVAEVTAFSAEGNVQIDAERRSGSRWALQGGVCLSDMRGCP